MKRMSVDFLSSLLFSVAGFLVFAGIYRVLERYGIDIDIGGDKSQVFSGLFIGLPIGGILGTWLSEKVIYGTQGWNVVGVVLSIMLCLACTYLGLAMMDRVGTGFIFVLPVLIGALCVVGYRIGLMLT
jgi:MFS family permease